MDNGSTDGTSHAVSAAFPTVRVARSDRNLGVTGGRNLGASLAISEFLLFLDHDTVVERDTVARLVRVALTEPRVGVAGAAILRHDLPTRVWALGTSVGLVTGRNRFLSSGFAYSNHLPETLDVPIVPTAFLVPKKVFELVGGFDDSFFAIYEDSDFCFRVRRLGYRVICATKALVWSKVERPSMVPRRLRNLGLENSFRAFYIGRNRVLFMKRHASPLGILIFAASFLPAYVLYFAATCVLYRQWNILSAFVAGTATGLRKNMPRIVNLNGQGGHCKARSRSRAPRTSFFSWRLMRSAGHLEDRLPGTLVDVVRRRLCLGATVLDAGYGTGQFIHALVRRNYVTGKVPGLDAHLTSLRSEVARNVLRNKKLRWSECIMFLFGEQFCLGEIALITRTAAYLILPLLPLTYPWIILRQFPKECDTIVDVGCGRGELMTAIRRTSKHYYFVVGLDIFQPNLELCKKKKTHDNLVRADVRQLPFRHWSVDVALCSQVLEHVSKQDGASLIEELNRITRIRIVIATPVGFFPYLPLDCGDDDKNPFNEHKAGWTADELENLGFRIVGQGLRAIYGERGWARKIPRRLLVLSYFASYLAQPVVYFSPNLAMYMIGVKAIPTNVRAFTRA